MTPLTAVIATDWFGAPHPAAPRFTLAHADGALTLTARADKPALLVPQDAGAYAEGLWEGDCAELFLVNPVTGAYAEFNLSPRGGWWSCAFGAPRARASGEPAPVPGVTTSGTVAPTHWEATLRIPVASLPAALAFDAGTTRANVTFCLGADPQRYFTYADLGGGKPDFHRPGRWLPLFA